MYDTGHVIERQVSDVDGFVLDVNGTRGLMLGYTSQSKLSLPGTHRDILLRNFIDG